LPLLDQIEGRIDDLLYLPDGSRVGQLSNAFKGELPIREAQVVQQALDRFQIRYVPANGFLPRHRLDLIERLRARLGPVTVELEALAEIPREGNGKFRTIVCQLPPCRRRDAAGRLAAEAGR
jgi:phenylacetate-CoA ligase